MTCAVNKLQANSKAEWMSEKLRTETYGGSGISGQD
jgi:hypothetical protein